MLVIGKGIKPALPKPGFIAVNEWLLKTTSKNLQLGATGQCGGCYFLE
jgi:hypothetical protein